MVLISSVAGLNPERPPTTAIVMGIKAREKNAMRRNMYFWAVQCYGNLGVYGGN